MLRIALFFATNIAIMVVISIVFSLLGLEGMDKSIAYKLASEGVVTREDLAELATDDLLEIVEMESEDAAALIMKARAHWFEAEQQA